MKLGVFDSGLGGIQITKAIRAAIPDIDMVYLGDTLHLPYGNRSKAAIYEYTRCCIDYLFREQDCNLIIVACNTASASALRQLQQTYLAQTYPDRRVLGVIVPTIEYALDQGHKTLGVIGTHFTITSNIFEEELHKIDPAIEIYQKSTPLLVPLIENDGFKWIDDILADYLKSLMVCGIQTLLLGCTHYVCLKDRIRKRYKIDVIAQDEIVPLKLIDYLQRHPEINDPITRQSETHFYMTDVTQNYIETASQLYGVPINLKHVEIHS